MQRFVLVASAICASAVQAHAADYGLHPFTIADATSVSITGVNDTGLATGTYASPAQRYGIGFVGTRRGVTTLALLGPQTPSKPNEQLNNTPAPTGISNRGTVIGSYLANEKQEFFVWRNGAYVATFDGLGGAYNHSCASPYVGTGDHIIVESSEGGNNCTGQSGTPAGISQLSLTFSADTSSVNARGVVAGDYLKVVGNTAHYVDFTYQPSEKASPHDVIPPGALSAYGGWINDAGQVAGSYEDAQHVRHGFLLTGGVYTSFDLPTQPVNLYVTGNDQYGRVVGTYTDSSKQYAFVFHAGTVTVLRTFPLQDQVANVSISHYGKFIAISDYNTSDGRTKSWLATCATGSAC